MQESRKAPHILIMDDNPTNLLLARAVLEAKGYRVRVATKGTELEPCLKERLPDLILMDIQLPDVDGLTLTRRLKADPATAHIPVIALTAYAMVGDEEKARAAGCDGYITKPFSPQILADRVAAMLGPTEQS